MTVALRTHFSSTSHVLVSVQCAIKLTAENIVSAYQREKRDGQFAFVIMADSAQRGDATSAFVFTAVAAASFGESTTGVSLSLT